MPKHLKGFHIFKLNTADSDMQGLDFDDMSSFFPCEIDDAIQYINLGYGAQAPQIVILMCMFSSFCVVFKFYFILSHFFSFYCFLKLFILILKNNYIIMVK